MVALDIATKRVRASKPTYNGSKIGNIKRTIEISVTMPATVATLKSLIASGADMVADVASLAGVGRVNCHQQGAVIQALVVQKHPQLEERPTIRAAAFGFVSGLLIGAFPDTRQILNCNNGIVLKGRQNNYFADVMVQPLLKAPLTSRQPLQNLSRPTTSR